MNSGKLCEKVILNFLKDPENLSQDVKTHLDTCENCKAELEKLRKAEALVKASAPQAPSMKNSVLSRIRDEKLAPAPISSSPKKHLPIGTISAVAAVLAVGILVYKGDILNKIDNAKSESEMIVYDRDAGLSPEDLVEEWNNNSGSSNSSQILTDSANNILYSTEIDDVCVTETAEAEEAVADEEADLKKLAADKTDDAAPTEAELNSDIVEKGHLLSLLPPSNESISEYSKPEGTQDTIIVQDTDASDRTAPDTTILNPAAGDKRAPGNTIASTRPSTGAGAAGGASGSITVAGKERTEEAINDSIIASLGNISEQSDAAEIYKVLCQFYPDRISYDVFINSDPAEYLAFVMSIDDFDTEYTESAFLGFCGKMLFSSFNKTDIL